MRSRSRTFTPLLSLALPFVLSLGLAHSLVSAGIALAESPPVPAPDGAKQKIIRELLETADSANLGMQFAQMMQQQLAFMYPTAPRKMWEDWLAELDPAIVNNQVITIYDQNFSHEELAGLLAFYKTPAGQATLEKMPTVMQQAMVAAQKWGQQEAVKMQDRLQKEGYQPVQSPPQ